MGAVENRRSICYLSGPISGKDLIERRKTFMSAKMMLEAAGYNVVNPMENGLPKESTTAQHMKRDIQLLTECDTVFMMDGWNHSHGCYTEFMVATAIGCEIIFESKMSDIKLGENKRFKTIFR